MTLAKVVRKGSYQGVAQWGINTSSEITPSRKTAQKWAELENARNATGHLPRTANERLPLAQKMLAERRMKALLSLAPRPEDAERFHKEFGIELKDYWEGALKLDVIKFDEFISPQENESTSDAIVRKYGQNACNFVRNLL